MEFIRTHNAFCHAFHYAACYQKMDLHVINQRKRRRQSHDFLKITLENLLLKTFLSLETCMLTLVKEIFDLHVTRQFLTQHKQIQLNSRGHHFEGMNPEYLTSFSSQHINKLERTTIDEKSKPSHDLIDVNIKLIRINSSCFMFVGQLALVVE